MRYTSWLLAGMAIAATLTMANVAEAFTLYTNRAAWQKAVSNVTTETFDTANTQILSFPFSMTSPTGIQFTANGDISFFNPVGDVGEVRPGTGAFSGGKEFRTYLKYDNFLSVVFPRTVAGFGFDYKGLTADFDQSFAETARVVGAFGQGGLNGVNIPRTDFPSNPDNDPETVAFFGIVADDPIRQIQLFGLASRLGEAQFEIDNLSFAADINQNPEIPTPALLPGLIGIGLAALRKSKSNSNQVAGEPES